MFDHKHEDRGHFNLYIRTFTSRAIQEELAGFLLKEVIAKKGEHFEDDDELNMP